MWFVVWDQAFQSQVFETKLFTDFRGFVGVVSDFQWFAIKPFNMFNDNFLKPTPFLNKHEFSDYLYLKLDLEVVNALHRQFHKLIGLSQFCQYSQTLTGGACGALWCWDSDWQQQSPRPEEDAQSDQAGSEPVWATKTKRSMIWSYGWLIPPTHRTPKVFEADQTWQDDARCKMLRNQFWQRGRPLMCTAPYRSTVSPTKSVLSPCAAANATEFLKNASNYVHPFCWTLWNIMFICIYNIIYWLEFSPSSSL